MHTLPDKSRDSISFSKTDLVVFGTPVYGGRVPNKILPEIQRIFEGGGALAGILNIADVDALICGGIGRGAVNAIEEAGIKLYAGASGSTDAVVETLIAGKLDANGEANCNHHDHGEGHSCRHGKCHE